MSSPVMLLILTVMLFSAVPFALSLLNNHLRTLYFYCYIGLLFFLGGTLTTIYSIELTEELSIPGGSLAYCAFMMTTILFVMLQRDLSTINHVLKLVIGINVFIYLLFSLISKSISSSDSTALGGALAQLFSQSLLVMLLGMLLIILELSFFLFAIEKIKKVIVETYSISLVYVLIFICIIIFDGIAFQVIIAGIFDLPIQNLQSQFTIKLLLAALFSVPMLMFLVVNKTKLGMYISEELDFSDLIVTSRSKLLDEIEKHREIAELSYQEVRDLAARLSIATESFDLGVWELDVDTGRCIWSEKMYALHNTSQNVFSHSLTEWKSFVLNDDLDSVTMTYQKVLNSKGDGEIIYRIKPINKDIRWIESHFKVFFDGDKPVKLIGLNFDITKRRELETLESKVKVEEFVSKKSDAINMLLGGIAHDFGNILQPLGGYARETLDIESLSSTGKKNLDHIITACSRSEHLLSRIQSLLSNYADERRPVKLQDIVRKVRKKADITLGHNISLELNLDDNCPPVLASPVHMFEVVKQIYKNAVHSMRERGGILSVSVKIQCGDGTEFEAQSECENAVFVELVVADEGEGIAAENMDKIFDPYFTTGHKDDGKGLGLTIVKNLVSSYYGNVQASSEPDIGTKISVTLPAYICDS